MNNTQLIQSGGVQTTVILPQIIYLDFDGELTRYNGELLTIDDVTVEDSGLTEERIAQITQALNDRFAGQNVLFVSDLSDLSGQSDYSTIYIGKTSSFAPYGSFAGLAETVDSGNKIKNDNAFVILDSTSDNAQIISTIAHETGHLLGTLDHGGEGLQKYGFYQRYDVSSGVTSTGIGLRLWDSMYVSSGGTANSTTVNSGGYLYVSSGGTALSIKENGGFVSVDDNANVTFLSNTCNVLVVSGNTATLHSGTTANNNIVNGDGYLFVYSGGTANHNTVNDGGRLYVSSGGVANSTTVNSGDLWYGFWFGGLCVMSGGTANSTTVNRGGSLSVLSGGTALSIEEGGGFVSVDDNAYVTFLSVTFYGLKVSSYRSTTLHSGTTANITTIDSTGYLYVYSGGVANSTTVNNDGMMYVYSGGVANSTTMSGGYLRVSSGGSAINVMIHSGGNLLVLSGGVANSTTVNNNGMMYVSSGGSAINVMIHSGGNLSVLRGGSADVTIDNPWDRGTVHSQAGAIVTSAYDTLVYLSNTESGLLSKGEVLSNVQLCSGDNVFALSGGRLSNTTINSGGSLSVSNGITACVTFVDNGGNMCVSEGGTAINVMIHSGGNLYVSSGGTANSTTMSGGYLYVSSGGTVDSTTVNSDGYLYVSSCGVANNTTVSGGYLYVSSDGVANSTTINSSGRLYVSSGGTVNSTTVNSGGYLYVYGCGVANNTTVSSGELYVSSDGVANSTTVNNSGRLYVSSGGTVNSTTVNSGGYLWVSSGGSAINVMIHSGGNLSVLSGGTADVFIDNPWDFGTVDSQAGAIVTSAYDTLVYWGNTESGLLSKGEVLSNVQLCSGDSVFALSGGRLSNTTIDNGGSLSVSNGITACVTVVDNGGNMYVSSGGSAIKVMIHSGGNLSVLSGGSADVVIDNPWDRGTVDSQSGAIVTSAYDTFVYVGSPEQGLISKGDHLSNVQLGSGGTAMILNGGVVTGIDGSDATLENNGVVSGAIHLSSGMTVRGSGAYYLNSNTEIASGVMGQTQDQILAGASTFSCFAAADRWIVQDKLLLKNAVITSGGSLILKKGASATIADNYGSLELSSKATARTLTVYSGAGVLVSGGLAALATISRGAGMELLNRGSSLRATVLGSLTVSSGGTATATSVGAGGVLTVLESGTVRSNTVTNGKMYLSGGTALSTTLVNGSQQIESGTAASNTLSGGEQRIGYLGQAVSNNIMSGGNQYVLSGGFASATALTNGNQELASGAYARQTTLQKGTQLIAGGALAESNTLTGAVQNISSGGKAVDNTLSDTTQNILSGAVAESTTVNYSGKQYVSDGGKASGTTVGNSGSGLVYAGGSSCDISVLSGGQYTVEDNGYAEDVTVSDNGKITVRGTVKNITIARNAVKNLELATAVFQGTLDCYLNPNELEDLHTILLFSELDTLTLRVNASQFGQDQYDVFSTEDNEEIDYRFMLVLGDGKAVAMVDGSRYWYNGECYYLRYDETISSYQLSKQKQEKTSNLLSASGDIDILEDQTQTVYWKQSDYQSYGEVIAVQENVQATVYLNTSVTIDGPLQEATAVNFTNGGILQWGANTMNILLHSNDESESILYGVHNADTVQRRLPSAPSVPSTVVMNISACALQGSAAATGYLNDRTKPAAAGAYSMIFSGGVAGKMELYASGCSAWAAGIYAGGRTLITESVNNTMNVTALASEGKAFAQGITRVKADEFDFDWTITAKSDKDNAEALGAAAYELDQFTKKAVLTVSATAGKYAYAVGFAGDTQETVQEYQNLDVTEKFAGTLSVQAKGRTAYAAGVARDLDLHGCVMAACITVSASGTGRAEACGFRGISRSGISGNVSVTAVSETADVKALGWLGTAGVLSSTLKVIAKGVTNVCAFGFAADELTPAKEGGVSGIGSKGSVSIYAESTNKDNLSRPPVYAIGGRVDSYVDGTVCAAAVAADPVQETHAAAVYAAALSVTGTVAANASTRAAAITANDEKTTLSLTISGSVFAGNSNASESELLAMLEAPAQYYEALENAEKQCLHAYSVYSYDGNDTIVLNSGSAVWGDMELAAGNNSITVSNGAFCIGDLAADNGSLAIKFVLDSALSENAVISCSKAGVFAEESTTVSIQVDDIVSNGCYKLAGGIRDAKEELTEVTLLYKGVSTVLHVGDEDYTALSDHGKYRCYFDDQTLVLEAVDVPYVPVPEDVPKNLKGSENGISWSPVARTDRYVVEYTTDEFTTGMRLYSEGTELDSYAVPENAYQWHVRTSGNMNWSDNAAFDAIAKPDPEIYVSDEDGISDIFFAGGSEVWESGYAAEHVGCGSWSGTGEQVELAGKNQITDVFEGSSDANILVLTDDENGDALFVDDIYSAFPDEEQARIAQINEIRAGQGDDVVDMTSQRFAYSGDGLIIRGGAGDDAIWANTGDNMLFGDAGNDRIVGASGNDVIAGGAGDDSMHGGGGDDIFCFCKGWGTDTVEQLPNGSVTLWFVSGSEDNWDQDTMTYLAGKNSVHVTGVTQVTLKFGDDGSELYDSLVAQGCFMAESSEKIWETTGQGTGIIASL